MGRLMETDMQALRSADCVHTLQQNVSLKLLPPFTSKPVCGKKCQTDTGPMQHAPVCTQLITFYVSGQAYINFGFALTDVLFCILCNTPLPQKHCKCMNKRRSFFFAAMGMDVCVMKYNYSTILLCHSKAHHSLHFLFFCIFFDFILAF